MRWTNEENAQEANLGAKVDVGDNYFLVQQTQDYFPVLNLDQNHGPFGSASPLCIHIDWARQEQKKMVDMYKSVLGFPNCTNSLNPKFRWQQNDPRTGVDFKVWKQHAQRVDSESQCSDGLYYATANGQGGKCYTYMILKRICLMVAFKDYPQTSSYAWEYRGGCYGSGEIGVYEKGVPGTTYMFD